MVHQHERPKEDSQISGMAWPATSSFVPKLQWDVTIRGDEPLVEKKLMGQIKKLQVHHLFTLMSFKICLAFFLL